MLKVKYVIVWLLALRSIYSTVMMSYDVETVWVYSVVFSTSCNKTTLLNIIEIYHVLHMYSTEFFSKWRTSIKYYFLLIAILKANLRYNNNINIVYNDTDDVVTNRR